MQGVAGIVRNYVDFGAGRSISTARGIIGVGSYTATSSGLHRYMLVDYD